MRFLLYALLFILLLPAGCKGKEETGVLPADFPYELLREGDLVFRRGTGLVSKVVIAADKGGSYSHIGIIVKEDSMWKVVHAVPGEPDYKGDPDRIKMEDLSQFFQKERAKAGVVVRPLADSTISRQAARHAVRLYQSGIRFDHQYNPNDTSRMYCTELIAHVYKQRGIDLPEGRITRLNVPGMSGDYILPSDILQNSTLCVIYSF